MKHLNNFYDTLQVSRSVNDAALYAAHRALGQKLHPDKNLDDVAGAARKLLQVNKAYEVLSNPQARVEYDAWIGKKLPGQASDNLAPGVKQAPAGQADFVDTQPLSVAAPVASVAAAASSAEVGLFHSPPMREPVHRSKPQEALDWLREHPLWLLLVVLVGVLLVAFAPWLRTVSIGSAKPVVPITPDLQPTYVEPAAQPAVAPVAPVVPLVVPAAEPTQVAPAVVSEVKPVRKATPPKPAAKRPATGQRKAPEPVVVPVQPSAPAPVAPPIDPGGHSGFAPKCRWVTPTKWSCE